MIVTTGSVRACPAAGRKTANAPSRTAAEYTVKGGRRRPPPTVATSLPGRRDPLEQACDREGLEPATELFRSHRCRLSFPQGLRLTLWSDLPKSAIPRTDASAPAQALGGERLRMTPCVGSCSNDEVNNRVSVSRLIISASPCAMSPSAKGGRSGSVLVIGWARAFSRCLRWK